MGTKLSGCIEIDEELCKGCLLCAEVCPKAIVVQSSRINTKGYKVAEVTEMTTCTGCASCAKMCPDYAITVYRESKEDA